MIRKYSNRLTWMIVCLLFFVLKSVYLMSKLMSNKLQMNEDKTDVLLVTAKRIVNLQHLPEFININGTCLKFSPSVRNLGVTLDSTLSLHQHVMNVCWVAYLELRHINFIRNLQSVDAVKSSLFTCVVSS